MSMTRVYLLVALLGLSVYSGVSHRIPRDTALSLENEIQSDYLPNELVRVKKSPEEKAAELKSSNDAVDKSKNEKRETISSQQTKLTDVDFKQSDNKLTDDAKTDRVQRRHTLVPDGMMVYQLPDMSNVHLNARTSSGPNQRLPLQQVDRIGYPIGFRSDLPSQSVGAPLLNEGQSLPIPLAGFQLSSNLYSGGGLPLQYNSYPPYHSGNGYPSLSPGLHGSLPGSYGASPLPYGSPYGSPLLPPGGGYLYQPSPYVCSCLPPSHPPHYQGRSVENTADNMAKFPFLFNGSKRGPYASRAVTPQTTTQNNLSECAIEALSNMNPDKTIMEGLVNMEEKKLKRIEECAKNNHLSKSDQEALMIQMNKEISLIKGQMSNLPQQTQLKT